MKTYRHIRQLNMGIAALFLLFLLYGCNDTTSPGGGREGEIKIEGTDVELKGFIESKGAMSLVVYGRDVVVTDSTSIENEYEAHITFADLIVGTFVEVHGTLQSDDSIVAAEISVDTRDDGR